MTTGHVTTPRWEWRTFGDTFPTAEAVIGALPGTTKSGAEVYLLSTTPGVNAKIRGQELDVKRLHQVAEGVELWSPVLKAAFPVTPEVIGALCAQWHVARPALIRPAYTLDQFLAEVLPAVPAVRTVRIAKERRQSTIGGCAVELSMVTVGHVRVQTVAVESERSEQIEPVVRRLGLSGVGNENYVAALRRLSVGDAHRRAQEGAPS